MRRKPLFDSTGELYSGRRKGRPITLTPHRKKRILEAIRIAGVTWEEAAKYAGVPSRTMHRWKSRAEAVGQVMPQDWRDQSVLELREMLDELGVDVALIRGSGKSGRVVREDIIRVLEYEFELLRQFFEELEMATFEGELAAAREIRSIGIGMRIGVDGKQTPIVTKEVRHYKNRKGGVTQIVEIHREAGPSERALRFILERRHKERWGRPEREIGGGGGGSQERGPIDLAEDIQKALAEMDQTVPAAVDVEDDLDDLEDPDEEDGDDDAAD